MSSAHHIPFIRMNAGPSSPWRTGWSARSAAQPECRTVTRVPVGTASNVTSTVVLSSGAKLPPRQSNRKRSGGCQTVIVPFVNVCGPDGDSNSSMSRPPSRGSNRTIAGLSSRKAKLRAASPPKIGLGRKNRERGSRVCRNGNAHRHAVGSRRHRFRVRSTWSRKADSSPIQNDSTSPSQPRSWSKGSFRSW